MTILLRKVGIRVGYQIKRKRERKERAAKREEKTPPFHPIPEIMYSYFLLISFSIDMQG
jgi:hypothetical protein